MSITEKVHTPRTVLSAVGQDGKGVCKYKCAYCFAAEPTYVPNVSTRSPATIEILRETAEDYEVLMLSCDTELFQDPKYALELLTQLTSLGKDITFSTKMILGDRIISELVRIQEVLVAQGNLLSISVSMPIFDQSGEIEVGVPSPIRRLSFLRKLKETGFYPFVGIRPLLPPSIVSNEEIGRIVEASLDVSYGYITGPYWFKTDNFGLLDQPGLTIHQRKAQWLDDDSSWYLYEDKEREMQIAEMISQKGGILFERSSEAIRQIKSASLRH